MTMLSNFGIKFLIILILVDIFEPPTIHVIGFLISDVTLFNAFISEVNCNPGYEGINFAISEIEA